MCVSAAAYAGQYAWANAARLQAALAEAGIEYRHHKELAPTTELRHLQYREDERLGVGKRSRPSWRPSTASATREILDRADSGRSWRSYPPSASALICVERDPEACHRSLIAERLAAEHRVEVFHLRPDPSAGCRAPARPRPPGTAISSSSGARPASAITVALERPHERQGHHLGGGSGRD